MLNLDIHDNNGNTYLDLLGLNTLTGVVTRDKVYTFKQLVSDSGTMNGVTNAGHGLDRGIGFDEMFMYFFLVSPRSSGTAEGEACGAQVA